MSIGDKLTPIAESFTLKDHTFAVLRAAILDMDIYSPNADLRLDERKLADKLGISRTPNTARHLHDWHKRTLFKSYPGRVFLSVAKQDKKS